MMLTVPWGESTFRSWVARGERMCLTRFGPRPDVYLPPDKAEALVSVDDPISPELAVELKSLPGVREVVPLSF